MTKAKNKEYDAPYEVKIFCIDWRDRDTKLEGRSTSQNDE